jgi:hypothetical protein
MRHRLWLVAATLLTACTEENAPTETAISPSFSISNAPFHSGLHVERGAVFLEALPIFDPEAGLAVNVASADGPPFCQESTEFFALLDVMFHGSRADPDLGGLLTQALFQGDGLLATVYSLEGEFTDLCDFLLNGTRLAEGTVRVLSTDNDVSAFLRNLPIRADAFGFQVHGIVNLTSGGLARLTVIDRVVFFPPDQTKETVRIDLKPIR